MQREHPVTRWISNNAQAYLGRSVNELQANLLQVSPGGVNLQRLPDDKRPLEGTDNTTLEEQEVLVDDTVVGPSSERVDGLVRDIVLGRTGLGVGTVGDPVDLLVLFGTVVVTVLTSTGNGVHDVGRVPSSDTSNLSETTVGLPGKPGNTPSVGNTLSSVTGGDSDDIDDLVLLEDGLDVDGLLEVSLGELDLVGDGTSVDLDLHQVGLLLGQAGLPDLGVGQNSDDGTVLPDPLEFTSDRGTVVLRVLLGVLGEGLLLGPVPVLVEPPLELVRQVLGPDGGQRPETSGSLDVSNDTNDDHGGSLDDGGGLDDLTLVHLCG